MIPVLCLLLRSSHARLPTQYARYRFCERGEGVQGVLTLFCSGAGQVVCHALRVEELSEQLEVEEDDGGRQE